MIANSDRIGLIELDYDGIIAFYLDTDNRYGVFISSEFEIVYFEFDTGAEWDKTTGTANGLKHVAEDAFRINGIALISWHFDYKDGTLIVIDNLDYIYLLELNTKYAEGSSSIEEMKIIFTPSGWDDYLMKQVIGLGEYRIFSNSDLHLSDRGRVVAYYGGNSDENIIKEWVGNAYDKIGEYLWISEDAKRTSDDDFSHIIIAFTSRSDEDSHHHINFFKIVEHRDGSLKVFEYKLNAILTNLSG